MIDVRVLSSLKLSIEVHNNQHRFIQSYQLQYRVITTVFLSCFQYPVKFVIEKEFVKDMKVFDRFK